MQTQTDTNQKKRFVKEGAIAEPANCSIPNDCISADMFFSTLRKAVKEHYENL